MPRDGSGVFSPPAGTTATAGTTIESAKYNAFVNDLVTDANTARPIVAGGTGATTAGAALSNLGGQPLDAGLTSIAGLTTAADRMIYTTAADTYAVATLTAAGRALLDDADAAAQLVTLGAQAADATLTSLAGLSLVAGDILYATGADTLARLPKGTARQSLAMNAGATAPEWGPPGGWTESAVVATTSGTAVDYASIPSGVRSLKIHLQGVGFSAANNLLIRIGPSAGIEETGYISGSAYAGSEVASTVGYIVSSGVHFGTLLLLKVPGANRWTISGNLSGNSSGNVLNVGGTKEIAGALSRIRLLGASGGTFNAGAVTFEWEF